MAAAAQSSVDPQTVLNMMREQCTDLSVKINTLDLDKTEHELVINALDPLPAERKCFRMIGQVRVCRRDHSISPLTASALCVVGAFFRPRHRTGVHA